MAPDPGTSDGRRNSGRGSGEIRASLLLDVAAGITIPSLVAGMLEPFATD